MLSFVMCLILFDGVIYILGSNTSNIFGKPSFESTWHDIKAQTPNVLTISHNLNEYPVKVDVQVKIEENGTEYIFTGLASAQVDDDMPQPYGGVVYTYNKTEILFIVPNKNNHHDAGGIAYTGSSDHYSGPNVVQGPYFNGSVKVRLWLACDMPPLLLNLSSYISAIDAYKEIHHGLGFYPDMVSVQLLLNDGYVSDVQGAVMNSDQTLNSRYTEISGVIFGYSDSLIRLWSPHRAPVFGNNDGWSTKKFYGYSFVRILAWNISDAQKVVHKHYTIGKNITHSDTVLFPKQIDFSNYLISVQVKVQTSNGNDMIFKAVGSSLTLGYSDFGGLVYVYTKNDLFLWSPDGITGHLIYIGGRWGAGVETMLCDIGEVQVIVYSLTDSTVSNYHDCTQQSTDLLFIVDTSASEINHVKSSIRFLNHTIDKLVLSANEFQVAIVTYDFKPKLHFDFKEHNKKSVMSFLETIHGERGATMTDPALQLASQILKDDSYGSRQNGSLQFIVVLSDGLSTDSTAAIRSAEDIRHNNGSIITIGVGNPINYSELLQISGRQDYVFCAYNPTSFYNAIRKETLNPGCEECYYQTNTDVIILLDTNKNQSKDDFLSRQYTIERFISKLSIANSNVTIGMFQYSDEPKVVFKLTSPTNKDAMIAKSRQVSQDRVYSSSNASHALYHIGKHGFQSSFGARQSARKFIVLVSDGFWTSVANTELIVEDLTNNNISIFGIAVGLESDVENFVEILSDPCHLFYVSDSDYSVLDILVSFTSYINCN